MKRGEPLCVAGSASTPAPAGSCGRRQTGASIPVDKKALGGVRDPAGAKREELSTWQTAFRQCAERARSAGQAAAEDIISDLACLTPDAEQTRGDIEMIRLIELVRGDGFAEAFERKVRDLEVWHFTRALVVNPLLPVARADVRRAFTEGFYETLPLNEVEHVGHA